MLNFNFCNPTRLIFGAGSIAHLTKVLPPEANILLMFGGGSVKRNGVYDQVVAALRGYCTTEFWGVEPNPTIETLREAIKLGRHKQVDFILAVGGGSVIDGAKLVSAAIPSDQDAWEIVRGGVYKGPFIPLGTVLTIPATGSEMNSGSVISCQATKEKFAFHGQFPTFSIVDPEVSYSLSHYQLACGLADSFVHVCEQYLTQPGQSRLMDRWAEGILLSLIEIAPDVLQTEQPIYQARAEFMVCATTALNGYIAWGVNQDWSTHYIGHEITALTGLTHGHSLVIVLPALLKVMSQTAKREKLLQYGERIWQITEGSEEERLAQAIDRTEQFFRSLGLSTRLETAKIPQSVVEEVIERFRTRETIMGETQEIDYRKVAEILQLAKN